MARQSISVGSQANDGTGDSLRTGAQKVNSTLTEIYNDLGNGTDLAITIAGVLIPGQTLRVGEGGKYVPANLNYTDLVNRPVIPEAQVQADWSINTQSSVAFIKNKPSVPTTVSTLTDVAIAAPVIGQALRWNGNGWINQNVIESVVQSFDNLSDVTISAGTLTTGQSIRYNGQVWVNSKINYSDLNAAPAFATVATSGTYADLTGKPDLSVFLTAQLPADWTATTGSTRILNKPTLFGGAYSDLTGLPTLATVATSGSYLDLSNRPSTLSPARTSIAGTTTSLSNDFAANLTISTGFKSYVLFKVQTSVAAWVTLYTDTTSRSNDTSRDITTDPSPGSGIIAEVITQSSGQTIIIAPGTIAWNDDSGTPTGNVYLKVVNKSGASSAVTVTLTVLQLEL
jgi:hypothetical protein